MAGARLYNQALEEELQKFKAKYRHLEDQLEEVSKNTHCIPTPTSVLPVTSDKVYLQNHITSLNETIGD